MEDSPSPPESEGHEGSPWRRWVTGVQVAYYIICRTKLWLFSHRIEMEQWHENVHVGRQLHEDRYRREMKEVAIGPTKYDFIRRGDIIEVHEIKKSRSLDEAHRLQMLYYLYTLNEGGVKAVGYIDYPLINRREKVVLDEDGAALVKSALKDIPAVIEGEMPLPVKKRYCRSCSYLEFCWGGADDEE